MPLMALFLPDLSLCLEITFDLLRVTGGANQFCPLPLGEAAIIMQPIHHYLGHFRLDACEFGPSLVSLMLL